MFGLGWIFLVSLCTLIFSVINRLKGRNDLRVFQAIRSGKDDDDQEVSQSFTAYESDVVLQSELIPSTNKYEFISGKYVRGFLEEPETKRFTVQELFVCSEKGLNLDYGDTQFPGNNLEEKVTTAFEEDSDHFSVEDDEDHFFHDPQLYSDEDSPANNNDRGENSLSVADADCKKEAKNSMSAADVNDQEEAEENNSVTEIYDQGKSEETFSLAEVNDQEKTEEAIFAAEVYDQEEAEENNSVAEIYDQEKAEETFSLAEVNDQEKAEEIVSVPEVYDQEKTEETIIVAEVNDQEKTEEIISVAEVYAQENAEDSARIQCYEGILEGKEAANLDDEDVFYQIQLFPEDQPSNEENRSAHKDFFLFLNNCEKMEKLEEEEDYLNQEPIQSKDKTADVEEGLIDTEPALHNSSDSRTELNHSFWDSDSDEEEEEDEELDILLQHQNLVQQIKMEMRNSRIRCLPTISEECETPKMEDDLKPLQINEKLEYKDRIEEIQKFYKCYAEKMRKLDILNYQTLNAISFIQLKDKETFKLGKKSLFSSNKLLPLPSLRGNKLRRIYVDQTHKSISELSHNLDLVYVGQACLSWEILCWQYEKTKELLEYDARGHHAYNHVAGEYQQFQVLLQRFVEDEPYQGHRLQYYAKNRCFLRSFLQVPSLKDDCSKEKKVGYYAEETDCISLVKMSEIIDKTMHIFWEFLHADKDEASLAVKSHSAKVNPADVELLMDVTATHHKKERKLKEIQKSGNCIVKKFQKQQQGRVKENRAVFICRVELRLVGKVLGLPRLTRDHLVWCKKKLENINIVGKKVSVEPSCLLFPC